MYQNTKSATTAGLLGIFLGAFGAHNWYLGEKGKGIAHVCMMSGGILIEIICVVVLPRVLSLSALLNMAAFLAILTPIAAIAMSASGIWGLVEGIIILSQGDAGLAQKGYSVATPQQPMNYGQPMNNGYGMPGNMGMNNNMGNMNGMNGNMGNMNGMNGNMGNMNGMNGNMGNMNGTANNMGGDNSASGTSSSSDGMNN